MNENLTFESLKHTNDYQEVINLIYQTDPYIYRDLFGDVKTAASVLRYSFENSSGVFYKKYIYIAKETSSIRVVGVALCHPNEFKWDQNSLLADFAEAGVIPPDSFFAAASYMNKTYNYRKLGSSICNVSVDPAYRNRGIGTYMIGELLKTRPHQLMELTVLRDNVPAIKLYQKLGFEIVGDAFLDYGGFNLPDVWCYKMISDR